MPADGGATALHDDCIPGAPSPCLHAPWSVNAGGKRVYLVNASLEVVCAVSYVGALLVEEALGRVPDGSSVLCATLPTPGAANVASTLR